MNLDCLYIISIRSISDAFHITGIQRIYVTAIFQLSRKKSNDIIFPHSSDIRLERICLIIPRSTEPFTLRF